MAFYLAVDLGTTGCRSIIFDEKLNIMGSSYEEYGLITPKEGFVEQKAELWWELTLKTAEKAIECSDVDPGEIYGISISSQGITLVPVDRELNPLCNALNWLDMRATEERDLIEKDFGGREIFYHTGKKNTPAYTLPKLLWIKKNCPEIFDRAYKFLMPMDYLIAKLTGECVTDYSMASGTLFYDIKNGCWSKKILEKYGIDEDKLPIIKASGSCVGKVKKEIIEKLKLNENCIVAVGAQDQKCAAYGAGLDEKTVTVSLGTAAAITKEWGIYAPEKCEDIPWSSYTSRDKWVTEGVIGTAGTSLRWLRDLVFKNEKYSVVDKEASEAIERGSSVMFFPYLSGPNCPEYYKESCGVFYGLGLASNRGDMAAAVMEGIAFRIRTLLKAMDVNTDDCRLVLFGGGAKGKLWPQIIADVTGMEIQIPSTEEAASAGAAVLAANGCGKNLGSLGRASVFSPSERQAYYNEKYEKFCKLEKKMWEEDQ
ncbi:MAG: hypothetical protein IJN17_05390 [Clostridia bacterium]|nr:hypothetical protein [Clostridia bacterium]